MAKGYSRTARVPGLPARQGAGDRRPAALQGPDPVRRRARPDSAPGRRRRCASAGSSPSRRPTSRTSCIEEGQPLTFVADFETLPPIDPGEYTGLTLRKQPAVLEVGAVDQALERAAAARRALASGRRPPGGRRRHAPARPHAHAARPASIELPGEAGRRRRDAGRQAGDAAERLDRARRRRPTRRGSTTI